MKVKEKTLRKEFGPLKLFLDDLYFIEEILKRDNETIEIETEDYKFSSIKELKETNDGETLTRLVMSTRSPYISVDLLPSSSYIYSSSDTTFAEGIFSKITKRFDGKERKPKYFYSFWPLIIGLNSFIYISYVPKIWDSLPRAVWLFLGFVIFSWYTYASYINLKKHSEINIIEKKNVKGYFSRNKDTITTAIISGLIVAIVMVYFPQLQSIIRSLFN